MGPDTLPALSPMRRLYQLPWDGVYRISISYLSLFLGIYPGCHFVMATLLMVVFMNCSLGYRYRKNCYLHFLGDQALTRAIPGALIVMWTAVQPNLGYCDFGHCEISETVIRGTCALLCLPGPYSRMESAIYSQTVSISITWLNRKQVHYGEQESDATPWKYATRRLQHKTALRGTENSEEKTWIYAAGSCSADSPVELGQKEP